MTPAARPVRDNPRRLRIAIVVHGRFHAFDLAQALMERGHCVRVFTNYPKWVTRRFGLPDQNVTTNTLHGVASKIFNQAKPFLPGIDEGPLLHRWFGRWAARKLSAGEYDVIHGFTQVAEEPLQTVNAPIHTVVRGSAHIRTQAEILTEEQLRAGVKLGKPSAWSIAREEREYALADRIVVLSTYAYNSFIAQGVNSNRLKIVPLGADTSHFRPDATILAERRNRILAGAPLRVLSVGTFSGQKGALDYSEIACQLHPSFRFRFVGAIEAEVAGLARKLSNRVEFVPRQRQSALPQQYAWGDLFLFPTLQDGFAVVLAQAQAAGLPILTTTNCCGPDLITNDQSGWVLPIRNPEAFVSRLRWCAQNRSRLADMVSFLEQNHQMRDWADVAVDFENTMYELLRSKPRQVAA